MSEVGDWLKALGLEKYAPSFEAAEIDVVTVAHLTEDDLKELGLPLGPRRKILASNTKAISPPDPQDLEEQTSPERRQLTVMFVDLVGSTDMSVRLDPEILNDLLKSYKDAVAHEVTLHGGAVAKYLGDGVLAYFGWPHAREDAAECSIRCAFQLLERVKTMRAPDGAALQSRIGVATGLVVVGGTTGSGTAREDTIAGEALNLAARLQALAEPDGVVVADTTRRLAARRFTFESLGDQTLKGFDRSIAAWRPVSEAATGSGLAGGRSAKAALIGREHELASLQDRWASAASGSGRAVLLFGEAGMGKSRLCEAFQAGLRTPHRLIVLQCSSFHETSALYPVIESISSLAGVNQADPPAERLRKLTALLSSADPTLERSIPLFAELLSIPPAAGYVASDLLPALRRSAIIAAVGDWITLAAEAEPLLLLVEDAHWMDATTLDLMTRLINGVGGAAMLILVTGRLHFASPWSGRSQVSIIALDRLDNRACEELVREITASRDVQPATLEQIVAKGDGNPLFLEELSWAVLESPSREGEAVPDTLQGSLMARLDQLQGAKQTAQICSVLGRRFARPLLLRIAGDDGPRLDLNLSLLVANEIIHPIGRASEGRYEFKHALVRDAAYGSLLLSRKRRLHESCARSLEQDFPESVRTEPELVAHHFAQAAMPTEASIYAEAAGDRGADSYAYVEAIANYREALSQTERLPTDEVRLRRELQLLLKLGPSVCIIGGPQHVEVGEIYARARKTAQALGDVEGLFKSVWGLWFQSNVSRQLTKAVAFAEELIALSERSSDDGHVLEALHCRWSSAMFQGEYVSASADAERGVGLYEPDRHHALTFSFGGHDPGVCACVVDGMCLVLTGQPEKGLARVTEGVALSERLKHPNSIAHALMCFLTAAVVARDHAAAAERALALYDLGSQYKFPPMTALGAYLVGWAEAQAGDATAGMARMEAEFPTLMRIGPMPLLYLALHADHLQRVGRAAEALAIIDDHMAGLKTADVGVLLSEVYRARGDCLEALGRSAEALQDLDRAAALAERQGARWLGMRVASSRVKAAAEGPDKVEAMSRLTDAIEAVSNVGSWPDLLDARALASKA